MARPRILAAGHVTVLTGGAHAHGSPLAMAWAASHAAFRPHGAFTPFAPFSSVVDDRTSYESEQRRRLMDFASIMGVCAPTLHESVCIAPYADARVVLDGRALFRVEPRRAGFRFYPTSAMDALVDRVKRLNAALLVVSTLDTIAAGASVSADLARDALRVMADVAARHRIAILMVHDAPPRGTADPVARAIFEPAPIVYAPASPRIQAHGRSRSRHRVTRRDIHRDGAPCPRPRGGAGPRSHGPFDGAIGH